MELQLDDVWSWKSRVLEELREDWDLSAVVSPHGLRASPRSPPCATWGFLIARRPQNCWHGGSGPQLEYSSKQGANDITFFDLALQVPQCHFGHLFW